MNRILLVDDDPLLLAMYKGALEQHEFRVEAASDGLSALQALRRAAPDLMVVDLLMPKFTGVDVLRFVRSQPALAALPVVVLSNSYMNELGRQAAELGARKALLKISCSPPHLARIIREILDGKPTSEDTSQLLAVPRLDAALPPADAPGSVSRASAATASAGAPPPPSPPAPAPALAIAPSPLSPAELEEETQFRSRVRPDFLNEAAVICGQLRSLCRDFSNAKNDLERASRLQHLYRKVHFTAAKAGLAECHQIAYMSSVFEALLFEALAKPSFITPSMMRTIAATVDFLEVLFAHAWQLTANQPVSGRVLVVDDDPLSNRLVCAALGHAHLQARAAEDPLVALEWATQGGFDVVLLDIEMPNLDGFEVCKRLRTLPAYRKVPVIFVTSHGDFESRAKSLLSGGDDLIAKPVFPLELAVKAVAHLLKRQVPEKTG